MKFAKLGRKKDVRERLLANLATSLILHENIITTQVKARAVKSYTEKIIALSVGGNLKNYRRILMLLNHNLPAAKKVREDLAGRFKSQCSGFISTVKIARRLGDNAPLVRLSLTKQVKDVVDNKQVKEKLNETNSKTNT